MEKEFPIVWPGQKKGWVAAVTVLTLICSVIAVTVLTKEWENRREQQLLAWVVEHYGPIASEVDQAELTGHLAMKTYPGFAITSSDARAYGPRYHLIVVHTPGGDVTFSGETIDQNGLTGFGYDWRSEATIRQKKTALKVLPKPEPPSSQPNGIILPAWLLFFVD